MVVKPARWSTLGPDWEPVPGDYKPTIPGDFLGIECEVINPPSAEGRKVYVCLDDEDVLWLLKQLRDEAIRVRRKAMPAL